MKSHKLILNINFKYLQVKYYYCLVEQALVSWPLTEVKYYSAVHGKCCLKIKKINIYLNKTCNDALGVIKTFNWLNISTNIKL